MATKTPLPNTDKRPLAPFQRRRQLERDLNHITEEMYRRNHELAETNKTLSLLRSIDSLVLDSHDSLAQVCTHISQAISTASNYPFVGIFTRASRSTSEFDLRGWHVNDDVQPSELKLGRPLHLKVDTDWFRGPDKNKLMSLDAIPDADVEKYVNYTPAELKGLRAQVPLSSLYFVKLFARHRIVGVIAIGFTTAQGSVDQSDTRIIDRLSESVGVALDNKLLFEENHRVLRQLRESNVKLKALDETKDDFISMASHQLRTPLTSVKGYLSMVLEEDAGPINETQKQMLGQALISSQRMVYLIADLLNVSRLKTGKFLIQPSAVNLATMVGEEIGQLTETAASRSLSLTYEKPAEFPELQLDETKTRQIIMNFVDNAIYYTPAGGHITVRLIDKPHTVELRVEDDGMGVPRSEQPHLFTKFYRAGNARKARPDGTGLGLFMAKKVIIAQGGALIFNSKEGVGSTFGFIFNKP